MKYAVRHTTLYKYADPVALCQNQAYLQPRRTDLQWRESFAIEIDPEPVVRRPWVDYFGNHVWYFSLEKPHEELSVTGRSVIHRQEPPLFDASQSASWEACRETILNPHTPDQRMALQFVLESPFVRYQSEALDYARKSFPPGRPLLSSALELTERVFTDFKYDATATTVSTPVAEVLKRRRGVCQDFAHLQITCFRSLGIPARYVSGYLLTDPPPGQSKLIGSDASHAWLSVYSPDLGWIDLDPTNNCIPGVRHITTAWGRDYSEICPIKGVFIGGGRHKMYVAVDVTPMEPVESN